MSDPCTCDTAKDCGSIACPHPEVHGDWRDDLRSLLTDAGQFVATDRSAAYGRPLVNHERIARLWSAWLGVELTAAQAAGAMLLVKVARLMESPGHRDSIADIIGYALVYSDCVNGEELLGCEGTDD